MPIKITKTVVTPIDRKRISIRKQIQKWENKLYELQESCKHKHAEKKNRGSSEDILNGRDAAYWRECSCPECGLHWNEDQR